jgi:hypothetical protein
MPGASSSAGKTISAPLTLCLTDAAEADLAEIWAYLASEASEAVANGFVGAIRECDCVMIDLARRFEWAPFICHRCRITKARASSGQQSPAGQSLVVARPCQYHAKGLGLL